MKRIAFFSLFIFAFIGLEAAYASIDIKHKECQGMVQYALSKHMEYSKGKTISELLNEVEYSQDNEKQKFYKSLVIEVLDTFAVWDDPNEKKRVDAEIKDHFFSICDPTRVKDVFIH